MMSGTGAEWWRTVFWVLSAAVYFIDYRGGRDPRRRSCCWEPPFLGVGLGWTCFAGGGGEQWEGACPTADGAWNLLGIASFWRAGIGPNLSYIANARRDGPWDNPNTYGLLMAAGAVVSAGWVFGVSGRRAASAWDVVKVRVLPGVLMLAAGGATAVGIWKSFSRGAWVAGIIGGAYLLVHGIRRKRKESLDASRFAWLCGPAAVAVLAVGVLLFWSCRYGQGIVLRRAVSVVNRDDFSWRNRVAAWEGTLQMMAERPWLGLGWNRPEPFYGHYYAPSRLDETAAVQLNDYLTLGATLGVPALFCFCMYLWLAFKGKAESGKQKAEMAELDWLKAVCRAGALVLAVGFWFDGGLFKLPTAATFWILLELGRV